ncbi:tyrosine-type recombinase/integrase [Flavobacterium sp. GT2N3]|uniref:tyrosine-type recombinase/integrase n=1 Tax=unclassified Flavobacterium TaxID=196869 RepID=UPI003AAC6D3E
MATALKNTLYFPQTYPMNFSGKLTSKIIIKDDYIRADGTCALFIQIFLNGERKRIPLHVSVGVIDFDKKKQRVKSKATFFKDYNLIIEKALGDINKIEIAYRLGGEVLSIEKLMYEYENPTSRIDFIKFWELEMATQKLIVQESTYKQQMSSLRKVKKYKSSILFYEITNDFFNTMINHFKKVEKNQSHTIHTVVKNFKKYLHIANDKGIVTNLNYKKVQTIRVSSNRTFLMPHEIYNLNEYYNSGFINESLKAILGRFLFSCFTGLRISDVQRITTENIIGHNLVFFAKKTDKLQRIQLNEPALSFIGTDKLFSGEFSDQHINQELKIIVKSVGITKKVTFHVGRHTFATNFLICKGRIEHLQKLLGHTDIKQTMIYSHIVESITDKQIHNMNDILKTKPLK